MLNDHTKKEWSWSEIHSKKTSLENTSKLMLSSSAPYRKHVRLLHYCRLEFPTKEEMGINDR